MLFYNLEIRDVSFTIQKVTRFYTKKCITFAGNLSFYWQSVEGEGYQVKVVFIMDSLEQSIWQK